MKRIEIPTLESTAQVTRRCPHCERNGGQIHQRRVQRPVDIRVEQVEKVRMRCAFCRRTWTCQPEGMKHGYSRSQRLRALNVLLYALGLSYGSVAMTTAALGAQQSETSVYDDVIDSGTRAEERHTRRVASLVGAVGIVGIDGTGQLLAEPGNSRSEGVMFAVEFGSGRLLRFAVVDERDAEGLQAFIDELRERFGVTEWVGDAHGNHRGRVDGDVYWICMAHFKKAKKTRLRRLRETAESEGSPVTERPRFRRSVRALERLLDEMPQGGEKRAFQVYRHWREARAPGEGETATPDLPASGLAQAGWSLKQLALEISEKWKPASTYTNNVTERAIGRCLKSRSKMMRGFKKPENISRFVHLCDWLTGGEGGTDLAELV
jgi:transposase-like protein